MGQMSTNITIVGAAVNAVHPAPSLKLASDSRDLLWHAAYTNANHEKRVAEQLTSRSVEYFLPLYPSVRHWKDRKVQLQLPLFPGYVFVKMALQDRMRVLQVPGVARLVGFDGRPSVLAQEEIEALKKLLACGIRAEPFPYLTRGRRMRISMGPLAGQEGIVVRRRGSVRVVLSLDLVQRSILVDVGADALEPCERSSARACEPLTQFGKRSELC
jgi:transcription antitermination factor NusG